jgi:Fe-S cluster assembly protein SufD
MALPQAKLDVTEARLRHLTLPASGGGLGDRARKAALARVRAMGLPARRDEYWKFTRPDSLTAPEAPEAAVFDRATRRRFSTRIDRLKLVFVDGVFDAEASDDLSLEG